MRRAQETAGCIASVTRLAVQSDVRLRERLNWDGSIPFDAFLALWARATHDRDLVPKGGQSSRQAAARLQAFLADMRFRCAYRYRGADGHPDTTIRNSTRTLSTAPV
jgi:broad specificity phosphatase PhoE